MGFKYQRILCVCLLIGQKKEDNFAERALMLCILCSLCIIERLLTGPASKALDPHIPGDVAVGVVIQED